MHSKHGIFPTDSLNNINILAKKNRFRLFQAILYPSVNLCTSKNKKSTRICKPKYTFAKVLLAQYINPMKRFSFLAILFILFTSTAGSQSVTITESGGWFEKAYVKWTANTDIEQFAVYYSGEGITDRKIDDQLIRNYGTYFRADIPGL